MRKRKLPVWSMLVLAAALAATVPGASSRGETGFTEQLARAQADEDQASVVELCRRQLDAPSARPAELLPVMFRAQVELKDYTRAGETIERMEKVLPPAQAAQIAEMRGDLALAGERPVEEAIGYWQAALRSHPADTAAILGKIAEAQDKHGDWSKAVETYRSFLRLKPAHAARRARLAACLLNTGDADAASKEMVAAIHLDAADDTVKGLAPMFDRLAAELPTLRGFTALAAKASGVPSAGVATFDPRASAKTRESASFDRALILYRIGARDAALRELQSADEATGGASLSVRLLRAQCLWRLDHPDQAAALRVAKIDDNNWFDDRPRLDRLRAADSPAAPGGITARQHLSRAGVLLDAHQPLLVLEDAQAGTNAGEKTGALAAEAQIVLAAAFFQNDRPTDALAAARAATELDARNADAWALRGRFEQETHADFPVAIDCLDRALAIRSDPAWLRRREVCLRTTGRLAEADRDAQRLATPPSR